jgi:Flp pilus assembly protein TadB
MLTLTVFVLAVIGVALVLAAFADRRRAREIQRDTAKMPSDPNRTSRPRPARDGDRAR